MKQCYVASPCGFAESTKHWYADKLIPRLEHHVSIVDPWAADISGIITAPADRRAELWMDLGDKHYSAIEGCQLLVAVLDQEPPDNGTVCEVAHAAAKGIPVLGYRNDDRSSGEVGVPVNMMILAAIRRSAGVFVTDLDALEMEVSARA